ncbi:MAG: hypothetical protein K0S55_716 [Clostridia bacterium]|nr:hypothetical protein [Clostridia bacterium]
MININYTIGVLKTMKYKAIIFDVGDTLIEYSPNYEEIYSEKLQALGFDISKETAAVVSEAVYSASGKQIQKEQMGAPRMSDEDYMKILNTAALSCVKENDNEFDLLLDKMNKMPEPKQQMKIKQGVFELLGKLREQQYILAIVSNHSISLMDYLKMNGLTDYFKSIIISDSVGVEKPNPIIMQLALQELNLKAENCLYAGDHPLDVLCAKSAGLDCAWIAPADKKLPSDINYKEDYRICHVTELLKILT